jgi:hypothetical protein
MITGPAHAIAFGRLLGTRPFHHSIAHQLATVAPLQPVPRPATALPVPTGFHTELLSGVGHRILGGLLAPVSAGFGMAASIGLAAIDSWALSGAQAALREAAGVIGATTGPRLDSAWFASEYWRVAGLAALLTLPFLFAAAVQAIFASDLALLARAVFCYLPLAILAIALATPLTMLLLAATDQMCTVVAAPGSHGGARFLVDAAAFGGAASLSGGAFLAFAVGALTVAGALALAIEMLVREAAVYIVVLMLPLAFAAFVWPARRIWAIRTVELLVALILSKFAIVAVLSLAGAAFGAGGGAGPVRLLTAMALVVLAAFAPWGIVRMLPLTEMAAGAAREIRSAPGRAVTGTAAASGAVDRVAQAIGGPDWAGAAPAAMAADAHAAGQTYRRSAPDDRPTEDRGYRPDNASDGVAEPPQGDGGPVPGQGGPAPGQSEPALEQGGPRREDGPPPEEERPAVDDIDPVLRAENWSWRPVVLGLDGGWPPKFGPAEPPAAPDDDPVDES